PMMHSSKFCESTPARRTASATTSAPSSVAVSDFSAPRNRPVGVRTAETMTASVTLAYRDGHHRICPEERLQASQDDRRGSGHFTGPEPARRVDDEGSVDEPDGRLAFERRPDGSPPRERHLTGREWRIAKQRGERTGKRRRQRAQHELQFYHQAI